MIRNAAPADHAALLALWQANAPRQGYASRPDDEVDRLLFRHPYFSYEYTFVRAEQGRAVAFICGCVGNDIPHGRERGCFTCLAADPAWDTPETTVQLLDALEEAFRVAGKTTSAVTFFNPMHLPWVIPGSPGHEHNNMPGIATDLPLHERMLAHGYTETTQETAMYRTLTDYAIPPEIRALEHRTAAEGCTLALYDPNRHHGLDAMLQALDNPDWTAPACRWLWQGTRWPVSQARFTRSLPAGASLRASASRRSTSTAIWASCFSFACVRRKNAPGQSICRCSPAWPTRHVASMKALVLPRCAPLAYC